jgi:NADH:ubiquinone oxidoreductase subunit F (NADH-binding)
MIPFTLYLSNGNSVYITPSAADNWGTDVVNTSGTNISGDGTAGNPLTVTETTTTLVDNADGTFTYTDETGTPITFDANIDDADADATNELQVLSFSNDTLYLSNGNSVYITPSAADNWGTDVVNTSGTNISGDGTAGNPLTVTETTTTLVDNADGTFTYTDETGTPITFDANIDDADADATNELQVLSFSNDTLYLSNGNSVYITPSAADNWGTDVVNTSGTNISGDGTAGNPLTVTETTTTLVDNADGTFTYTDETGTPITFDANIDDADADATNELQVLSFSNDTLYLSNGNSVYITPSAADNWGTDVVNTSGTNISGDGTAGNPLTVTETTTTLVDNADGTFTYTDETGTPITFDANIDDADADATNELQVLSFSNDTLYLSNGNSVYITPSAADNWGTDVVNTSGTNISGDGTAGNPLTVTETTTTLVDNADGTFTYTDETGTPITFDANIDDADADATNELQVLSFSNDTLYLSNGNSVYITPSAADNWGTDVVNTSGTNISGDGTAGNPLTVTETTTTLVDNADGTFTYTDETGTPITFDANIDDADADATNELQVLSFSNDTLYLSNGNSVYITPSAADNWGTDVVNTSGTNISGDGTAGNPLTVTETTTTLVDNADGTFTYTDETGTPITFDANIDDADADATNELQVLSFSNDTLYLSNGNSVYITPSAADNWGTDVVNTSGTNISGDGTAGNPLTVTETTTTLVDNADGTFTYTDETGTPITFDANIDDADADATNELQVLSFSNDTLYLSNGNSVYITPSAADNWGTDVVNTSGTNISGDGTAGNPLTVTETTTTLVDNADGTFTYTDETGTPITFDANIDDADADATNELQVLSFSNDTLYLSNGNSVYITPSAADNWGTDVVNTSGTNISGDGTAGNPLTVTESTSTLVDNADGTFTYTDETGTPITFDANIDDADADATNELQVLSFSNDTLYLSNGNSVYITPGAGDNWGTDVVNTSGTNISGNGTVGSPLTVTETTTTLVDNGNGTFTYTDETGTPITFDANIDDADADATNELQVLSFSNDTLYLSNGNSVYITPGAGDNWGTDVVNTSGTNISGNGTVGSPLTVTETTTTLVDNGNGTFTYTDETGTPIYFRC